jgi:translation initiation factor 2 beta subunit (eIF-2beta)/eIF-5
LYFLIINCLEFKPVYPSSSLKNVDWDKVEKDIEKEEKEDPDSDVNSLFSKIYESGDENTKKAMIKSMVSYQLIAGKLSQRVELRVKVCIV